MLCFLGLHKWSKWKQYTVTGAKILVPIVEKRQKRKCKRCGKIEDELISYN